MDETEDHSHCKKCGKPVKKIYGRKPSEDFYPELCTACGGY
jgi:NAD-dependent SIR2 family protein deacetylase